MNRAATRNRRMAMALLAAAVAVGGAVAAQGASPLEKLAPDAAQRTYVAPGQKDALYAFMSGGFNGQIGVYGLPSGRRLKTIHVFSVNPETGYGYSEETKPMLQTSFGFMPWDDSHHPKLSQTAGVADGRWLFINGNNTPRVARIDLRTFETAEIIEIPNSGGNHSSPYLTEDTRYVVAGTRFGVPAPQKDMPVKDYKGNIKGVLSFIRVAEEGRMDLAFQVLMPGFDWDLAHCGKGPSHGWCFFSSYNSEEAYRLLEVNASQADKDFIAAVNWKRAEECVAQGKAETWSTPYRVNRRPEDTRVAVSTELKSQKVLKPEACPGMVYLLPTPKSPHGVDVDPTGEYIVGGGKLSATIPVHGFSKMLAAIKNKEVEGKVYGIDVLKYSATIAGEVVKACLGPLHTEFDAAGYAYNSCFLSSEIIKWKLGEWKVVDRVPTYYSIGHLMVPGGDSRSPWGKYVVALNKITKDRYLPTGPELTQSAQLYDISGDKMQLILDFPTEGEPHYAQAIPAEKIAAQSVRMFKLAENKNPHAIKAEKDAKVVRKGKDVHVYMTAIRSHFAPDVVEGIHVGDNVYFHVTNLEQDWDVPHGFATMGNPNGDLLIMPGETLTVAWTPQRPGVFPFYCTDFCSALHQEMQGYVRVSPAGANTPVAWEPRP